ncbi:MAG: T9SS type A sorting domain-containing protein [Candidatus Cloacimonetes bacterium]|nr:T9SS type A sorting domain-containing protein [Candidatus Cloacimonadota bacterium]
MRKYIIFVLLLVSGLSVLVAAGPGDVSSGLQMWLDANALTGLNNNDPVSSWTDQSGNAKHAVQDTVNLRPLYKTNIINGKPAIVFDGLTNGTGDYLSIDGSIILNTNYTIIAVVKRTSSSPSSLHMFLGGIEKTQNKNLHVGWRSNSTFTHAQYTNDYDIRVANYAAAAPPNVITIRHSNTLGNDTYINGALRGLNMNVATSGRLAHLTDWQGASIGRYIDGSINNRLNGWMAELIVYNRYLSETERKAVESYLANKYALTVYSTATPAHYTDMFELTVLNTKLTETKTSGGLSIKGDYLTAFARVRAGHDAETGLSSTFNPDSGAYPDFQRIKREWFIEVTSSNLNTTFSFDMNVLQPTMGNPSGDKYRLLYRDNSNSNYTILAGSPSINGKVISFTVNPSVTITSSGLYTLGTIEPSESTLPVELSSFTAIVMSQSSIRLNWTTQSETGVSGYYLLRNTSSDLATAMIVSPLIHAQNSSSSSFYSWTDTEIFEAGVYYYWLQSIDFDGSHEFHGPVSTSYFIDDNPTPQSTLTTGISRTYPNPFNPSLSISYGIKETASVSIKIYNVRGQEMKQWSFPSQTPGTNTVVWNANSAPSGVYIIDFKAGAFRETKKVTMTK